MLTVELVKKPRKYKNPYKFAWDLMSKLVRLKNADWKGNVKCFTCSAQGNYKDFDASHYIHRNSLDFDQTNIQVQCSKCNRHLSGNLGKFAYEIIQKYGIKELERLEGLRFKERYFTQKELYAIIGNLKDEIKKFGNK